MRYEHTFDTLVVMIEQRFDEALELSPAELDARVRTLLLHKREVEAELATALAVIEQRGDHVGDGHRSLNAYVRAIDNCSAGAASVMVRRARLMNEEPAIGRLLHDGHIGVAQADRLARAAQHPRAGHAFRDVRDELADHAEHSSWNVFETEVARFEKLADLDGAHADDRANIDRRTATVTSQSDGVHIAAHGGDALQAAELVAVFEQAKQDQFQADVDTRRRVHGDDAASHPLPRTAAQRAFDALYEIVMSYVTAPTDGRRPEPIVNIVVDQVTAGEVLHAHGLSDRPDVFTAGDIDLAMSDRRCETSTGDVMHPDLVLQAMLRGHVRRVVVDSASVIIDMGRERRLFTGKSRPAARLLARECSALGCTIPAEFCDVDHLDEHHAGGRTDQTNGGPCCGRHNRFKHRTRLRARRAASGRVRWIRPDGTVVAPAGERDPEWADVQPHDHHPGLRSVTWEHFTRRASGIAPGTPDPGFEFYEISGERLRATA